MDAVFSNDGFGTTTPRFFYYHFYFNVKMQVFFIFKKSSTNKRISFEMVKWRRETPESL